MLSTSLRLIRQYHNINQTRLAAKLNISTSYLSELEAGKKDVSIDLLQRYATIFDVPLSSLVVFSETLDGEHSDRKARSFIAKKMLKILDWIADTTDDDAIPKTPNLPA